MPASQRNAQEGFGGSGLVLGIDTCGPSGSVALGQLDAAAIQVLGLTELAGRSYSATLVAAVAELLQQREAALKNLKAIVVVNGPGSFTGVRVGLSAVKGLAEPAGIPVVAVSRLAVLAMKANALCAALDAHRHEVFLRLDGEHRSPREVLAGVEELRAIEIQPRRVGVCDEGAAALLSEVWPEVELATVDAPTAGDALKFTGLETLAGQYVDLALLDGHYLRRSDAEIFGEQAKSPAKVDSTKAQIVLREMRDSDIVKVMEIAAAEREAPQWTREAYQAAITPVLQRRVALVAEDRSTGVLAGIIVLSITAPEAELESIVTAVEFKRRGVAKRLLHSLASNLRHAGVREVHLEVRASNLPALALYQALGFVESGRRPRYYAEPVEDAVLMRLRLS
jgi:tRNA threonylcarbamoyladenosine biosynthesis protein TsaB